jgi:hypothetical protein
VDVGVIESISYPDVFNRTLPLRNGSYAGFYGTVALDVVSNSKISTPKNKQAPFSSTPWSLLGGKGMKAIYDAQSHLGNINPFKKGQDDLANIPRRMRLRGNMIHAWDKAGDENIKLDTGEVQQRTEDTAIYNFCRKFTFEAVKLQIRVAGNCALHVGNPITVEIPKMLADKGKEEMDDVYTGVYIIVGVRHKIGGDVMHTELVLVKDSLGSAKGK